LRVIRQPCPWLAGTVPFPPELRGEPKIGREEAHALAMRALLCGSLTPRQIDAIAELIAAKPAVLVIPMEAFVGTRPLPVLRVPVSYFFK